MGVGYMNSFKLKVNNFTYTLKVVGQSNPNLSEDVIGETVNADKIIYICKDYGRDEILDTLWHELTHAFLYSYGFFGFSSFDHESLSYFIGAHGEKMAEIVNQFKEHMGWMPKSAW